MFDAESDRTTEAGTPLTGAQSGIWLAQQIEPDSSAYALAFVLDLRGDVDHGRLAAAVRRAVEEAEALHVRVTADDTGPRQRIARVPVDVPVLDLRDEPDPDRAAAAWMDADRDRPADLTAGPLYAQAVLRLADDHVLWYQRYHHILVDGLGVALVTRRAGEIYGAGEQPPPAADWTLARLTDADRAYRASGRHRTDRAHWLDRMADRPEPVRLVERAPAPMTRRVRRSTLLDARATARLDAAARGTGVRRSRLLITAVAAYLHRVTGAPDLVLGLPVTARSDDATATVPGMVSNVVPLRVRVGPGTTGAELAARIRDTVAEAVDHGRYRAEDLARDLGLADGLAELVGPTVNILPGTTALPFAGLTAELHPLWLGPAGDLAFTFTHTPDGHGVRVHLDADAAMCDEAALRAHERRFLALLDTLAEDPHRPLGRIDLTDAGERRALLHEFGVSPREVPELTWPAAFEQQVRSTPDAVALVFEDRHLTYAGLNADANRLARLLTSRGVRAEDVVAVALPRSPELVVCLLAVLKTGAAYLPLDADHPRDRIAHMLSDADARTVVTVTALAGELPDTRATRVLLDDPETAAEQAAQDASDLALPLTLDRAAYVIYTSGSTGR
ncbi:AMP-binding protein, partial [Streptomyces sp. SID7804]